MLATDEKYNEAIFSAAKRLAAAIDGLPDTGGPSFKENKRESNFRTKEETEEKRGQFTLVGGGLLPSSSPAASSAHVRSSSSAAARPRERAEREAEVVAHPLGSSHGEQLLRRAGREGRAKPVVRATSRRWAMELWPWRAAPGGAPARGRRSMACLAISHPGARAGRRS